MNLSPAKFSPPAFLTLLAALMMLAAGCYFPPDGQSGYATGSRPVSAPGVIIPTALVIVVEGESTESDYQARRSEIIDYLIQRGYIAHEDELVSDPANADRIIRAIISGGGFTLSVFNQNTAAGPVPDLEVSDILYPADPYFILGFYYVDEIGRRRLPPRPPGYHPHPRPPHTGPPPGRRVFDHDRHWSHPGQPKHNDGPPGRPTDRRSRDDNHPPSNQSAHPPPPAPARKPEDHGPPRADNRAKPPPGVPSQGRNHSRPDQDGHASPAANPPKSPERTPSRGDAPPAAIQPRSPDRPPSRGTDRPPPRGDAPAARSAPPSPPRPAPERSEGSDKKDPPADDKSSRKTQQN